MILYRTKFSRSMICFIFIALLTFPLNVSAYDARINPAPREDGYIIPHSAEERLSIKDLAGLDIKVVELAKNEIYARHGLIFQHESMNAYFTKKTWYKADSAFKKDSLNHAEAANVRLLEGIMRDPQKLENAEMAEMPEMASDIFIGIPADILVNAVRADETELMQFFSLSVNEELNEESGQEDSVFASAAEANTYEAGTPKSEIEKIIESFRILALEEQNMGRAVFQQAALPPQKTEQKDSPKPVNTGDLIVSTARTQIGKPYRFGSSDPARGFDCSGLINWVYRQYGISTPRSTPDLQKIGIHVPPNQLKPGDIVITRNRRSRDSPHGLHAGIYAGNGMMIHAPGRRRHVVSVKMTHFNVREGRRVI